MKFDTISISSDDDDDVPLKSYGMHSSDDDDVPLKLYGRHIDSETADGLKAHSIQQCEFCDEVFFNRYNALIHNAKHIIIPLLKQNVHQCMECLYYFTSQEELKHHKKTKHKHEEIRNDINYEKDTKIKNETHLHMAISDIVKKELDIKLEDYIVQNKLDVPVKVKQELEVKKDDCTDRDCLEATVNEKLKNHLIAEAKVKIINRLRFEDDSDSESTEIVNDDLVVGSNGLLNDLTTVCKVNLNLFDKPWHDDDSQKMNATNKVSGNNVIDTKKQEDEMNVEEYAASTHYDDLVKPGMYRCKRCMERFPTRFQLIQHDMSHVKIRKSRPLLCIFCERFISNNRALLKRHVERQHPSRVTTHRPLLPSCKRCGLRYYNYIKHMDNYHSLTYCHMCKKGFETEEEKIIHIKEHLVETKCYQCDMVSTAIEIQEHQRLCHRVSTVSMIKLCEMCCLFLKNKHNMQYVFVKSVSEVGSRLNCERCGKMFFELKLVRRLHKRREREPVQEGERERKKCLSNSERLKNIQHRLKMINKLSRCYVFVSFCYPQRQYKWKIIYSAIRQALILPAHPTHLLQSPNACVRSV